MKVSGETLTAISAIIGAILVFIQSNKNNRLNYLSEEEAKRHKDFQGIIRKLYNTTSKEKVYKELNRLKPMLNPYGKRDGAIGSKTSYLKDVHIWKTVNKLEKNFIKQDVDKLIDYLELLLKYEKEKRKNKLKYNLFDFFIICSLLIEMCLLGVWIVKPEWKATPDLIIPRWFPYIGGFSTLISATIYYYYKKGKVLFLSNSPDKMLPVFLILFLLPYYILVDRFGNAIFESLKNFYIFENIQKEAVITLIKAGLFVLEIAILLLTNEVTNEYINEISNVEFVYLTEEMKEIYTYLSEREQERKNRYLSDVFDNLDKKLSIVEKKDISVNSIQSKIKYITSNYLWRLSAYRKQIKHILNYIKRGDKTAVSYYLNYIKNSFIKLLKRR